MGLDMYLEAEQYVSGWEHGGEAEKAQFAAILEAADLADLTINDSPSGKVTVTVAYWRKSNHIHKWFVDNVQNGADECQRSYVDRSQLIELRDLCAGVLAASRLVDGEVVTGKRFVDNEWQPIVEDGQVIVDPSVAQERLPTESGFFFGSTDYDEWYYRDLEDTVEQLDAVLSKTEGKPVEFYYRASW